jgi:hypothetical protein
MRTSCCSLLLAIGLAFCVTASAQAQVTPQSTSDGSGNVLFGYKPTPTSPSATTKQRMESDGDFWALGTITAGSNVTGTNLTATNNVTATQNLKGNFLQLTQKAITAGVTGCVPADVGKLARASDNKPVYCDAASAKWQNIISPPNTTVNPANACTSPNYLQWTGSSYTCSKPTGTVCATGQALIGSTCYVMPTCAAGQVLTFNNGFGCMQNTANMSCPAGTVLQGFSGGVPQCVVPNTAPLLTSKLNIIQVEEDFCSRDDGPFSVVSTCPDGYELLGCGGGPGDQGEIDEYWILAPDFAGRRCTGYVRMPRCDSSDLNSGVRVISSCYEP